MFYLPQIQLIPFAANVMAFDDNNNLISSDSVYDHNRIFLSRNKKKAERYK